MKDRSQIFHQPRGECLGGKSPALFEGWGQQRETITRLCSYKNNKISLPKVYLLVILQRALDAPPFLFSF